MVHTLGVCSYVRAAKGRLCGAFAEHRILLRAQQLLPFLFGHLGHIHAYIIPFNHEGCRYGSVRGKIMFMNRTLLVVLLVVLSLFGIVDSWYLYQSAVTDTALTCDIGAGLDGCNIVAQSPYSQFMGLPLALYGIGFFSLLFMLSMALLVLPVRLLYRAIYILSLLGAVASVVFLFIQFALIKAICIYCIASAGIVFGMYVVSRVLWKRFTPSVPSL